MSTSCVLLSTYNGEKYLIEQLDSLKNQSRKIDKVIIKDDCSKDKTVEIVNSYIQKYNLDNWFLIVNKENLGWKKNFVSMLDYVNTDFFFFCDQDDIWYLNKVEKMINIIENNEQIDLLVSDYYPFFENGKEPKKNEKHTNKVLRINQRNFVINRYPGCVMCLRTSTMKQHYYKFWNEDIPHDSFASLCAQSLDGFYYYDDFMIKYRRHSNTATHPTVLNRNERILENEYYFSLLDIYKCIGNRKNDDVYDVNNWISNRYTALKNKNPFILFRNLKYLDLYWSFSTYLMDFICSAGFR